MEVSVPPGVDSSRVGKLLKIQLINFMCHENFVVCLNPRLNYLVGSNGSGKSAVITAISVGLGGRALDTNRSDNIKKLIRNGANSATIKIHLSNCGGVDRPYRHDEYGNVIIVERHLTISGSSTYKICNEEGKVKSKSAKELREMLFYLNIHVENPMIVLNQEAAKTFLRKNDPKQFYKLFMKATYVEEMLKTVNHCVELHKGFIPKIEMVKNNYEKVNQKYNVLKKEVTNLDSLKGIKEAVNKLKLEIRWIDVNDQECLVKQLQSVIDTTDAEIEELSSVIVNRSEKESEIKRNIERISQEERDMMDSRNGVKTEQTQIQSEFNILDNQKMSTESAVKVLEAQVENVRKNIDDYENHLNAIPSASDIEKQKREDELKLINLKERKVETTAMMENATRDYERMCQTLYTLKDKISGEQTNISCTKTQMQSVSEQLRQLSLNNDKVEYGRHMPQLLSTIKRLHEQKRFSQMPIGPIGSYVQVADAKFRGVLENIMGQMLLCGFMVDNDHDRMTLKRLIDTEFKGINVTIFTTKFTSKKYDIRNGRVSALPFATPAIDLIRVDDPNVFNCIVDQKKIETILVVETTSDGASITMHKNSVPRNMSKVYALSPPSEIFPAPRYRMYGLKLQVRYLQVNKADLALLERQKLQELKQQMQSAQEQFKVLNTQLQRNEKVCTEKQKERSLHKNNLDNMEEQIRELSSTNYQIGEKYQMLEKELIQYKNEVEVLEQRLQEKTANLKSAEQAERDCLIKKDTLERKLREYETQLTKTRQNKQNLQHELYKIISDETYNKQQLKKLDETKKKLINDLTIESTKCNKLSVAASKHGERINTKRNVEDVNKEIEEKETLQRTLNKNQRTLAEAQMDLDDVKELRTLKKLYLDKSRSIREYLLTILRNLHEDAILRRDTFQLRLNVKFSSILAIRQFRGSIECNNNRETLTLNVTPNRNNESGTQTSAKSLSGGECSFSTLALMIALWVCVDHPFFCLDEYDVFTDEVNRHQMNLLLKREANMHPDRQYILLTPQDMSNLQQDEITTIHLMEPPKR